MAIPALRRVEGGSGCAGSSDMSAAGPRSRCSCRDSSASSTGAMTRPGSRSSRRTASSTSAPSAISAFLKEAAGSNGSRLDHRARAHALGDPRRRHRAERASADAVRRAQDGDRPERDRRELPRAARRASGRGSHVHVGDGRGSRRAPARGRLRRRPRRSRARCVREARRPLHLRPHPPRPSEPARRRPAPDADGRRARRRRELPRVEPRGVPRRDPPRAVPERRRDRVDHARAASPSPMR